MSDGWVSPGGRGGLVPNTLHPAGPGLWCGCGGTCASISCQILYQHTDSHLPHGINPLPDVARLCPAWNGVWPRKTIADVAICRSLNFGGFSHG